MNSIFDSASALQRFKSRHALQISSPNHASSYILSCKIKKILNQEFTDEVYLQYFEEYEFSTKSKMDRFTKLNQFVARLERLDTPIMKLILAEYEESGIHGLIALLSQPIAKLIRLTRKQNEVEVY